MKYFHKIGNRFDPEPILDDLHGQPLIWGKSPRVTFPGSPHADVEDVIIRGPVGYEYKTLQELHEELSCTNYPAAELMQRTLLVASNLAYLLSDPGIRDTHPLQLGRVILTKLRPGKTIHPHRDEGPVPQFYRRICLVVQGGDENVFMINGEVQPMQTGEMWETDVREIHTVINLMPIDRIHLIVDIER